MANELDFFFYIGSTYSYLSVYRADEIARRANVKLRWRPFNVRAIMLEQNNRPFIGKPAKLRYMWRDLERRAARHGIPFKGIPEYPVDPESLAGRVAYVAAQEGWCAEFSKEIYRLWFLEGKPPGTPDHAASVIALLGRDPEIAIMRANSPEIRASYDAETEMAKSLGIFGSPTFVCGKEIFWGDDRLEDAIEWAST